MAITFDAGTAAASGGASTTHDWTHVTGTGATVLILVLANNGPYSTVQYNGVDCTHILDGTSNRWTMYYLVNPASGSHTVHTIGANDSFWGGSITYKGTKTDASVIGTTASASGTGITSISKAITTTTDNSVIVTGWMSNGGSAQSAFSTSGTGNTDRFDDVPFSANQAHGSEMTTTTAGSYTPGWSWSGSANGVELLLVELLSAGGGGGAITHRRTLMGVGL